MVAAWTALGPKVKGNGPGDHPGKTGPLGMGLTVKARSQRAAGLGCPSELVFTELLNGDLKQ